MADLTEEDTVVEDADVVAESLDLEPTTVTNEEDSMVANTADEKQGSERLAQLPHTRVRNMMRLDSDLHIASQDSVFLVTKAAVC